METSFAGRQKNVAKKGVGKRGRRNSIYSRLNRSCLVDSNNISQQAPFLGIADVNDASLYLLDFRLSTPILAYATHKYDRRCRA